MDKARNNKNRNECSQKQHNKVGDPNDCKNNTSAQHQFSNAYKQIFLEIYKGQQETVFINFGCGQIKGDDYCPHIVAHERKDNETDEKKSQYDTRKKPVGVVVKKYTVTK